MNKYFSDSFLYFSSKIHITIKSEHIIQQAVRLSKKNDRKKCHK